MHPTLSRIVDWILWRNHTLSDSVSKKDCQDVGVKLEKTQDAPEKPSEVKSPYCSCGIIHPKSFHEMEFKNDKFSIIVKLTKDGAEEVLRKTNENSEIRLGLIGKECAMSMVIGKNLSNVMRNEIENKMVSGIELPEVLKKIMEESSG